jgi:hypothetical protein
VAAVLRPTPPTGGAARSLSRIAVVAAACLLAGTVTAADGLRVSSIWDIQASEAWAGEREIGKGDLLVAPDILPQALIALTEDVAGEGGKTLLRRGDLLYRLTTARGAVYCTVDRQKKTGTESLTVGALGVLVCPVDTDSDGVFEGYYRKIATDGVPIIFGSVPAALKPIGPIRYEARQPAMLAGRHAMRVTLASDPARAKHLRFVYAAGSEQSAVPLARTTKVASGPFPQHFEVLGGRFELRGVRDGKAIVHMLAPTRPHPFGMQSTYVRF